MARDTDDDLLLTRAERTDFRETTRYDEVMDIVLLRRFTTGVYPAWTDSVVLLVAPIYNADGNERVRLDNRPWQKCTPRTARIHAYRLIPVLRVRAARR